MGDLPQKSAALALPLSMDDATKRFGDWLDTTKRGRRFLTHFNLASLHLGEDDMTEESIKPEIHGLLTLIQWSFQGRDKNGVPPDLSRYIFGSNKNEKTLCDLPRLKELILNGDPVAFALGSFVDDHGVTQAHCEEQCVILSKAFAAPFRGDALSWLKTSLGVYSKAYSGDKYYGKVIPIVQSSGMGKSRLMAELAQNEFLVSVCVRDMRGEKSGLEANPQSSWPPRDEPACDFFYNGGQRAAGLSSREFHGEELAGAFLGALLTVAADLLEDSDTPSTFVRKWDISEPKNILASERHKLFEKVCDLAESMLRERKVELDNARRLHLPAPPAPKVAAPGVSALTGRTTIDTPTWCAKLFSYFIASPARRIEELCRSRDKTDFILVFDECSELDIAPYLQGNISPPMGMSLVALQNMLKSCDHLPIWTFLLGTNSGLDYVAPYTGGFGPSARPIEMSVPLPPLHYLGYNVMARGSPPPATMSDALLIRHIRNYGRPLWQSISPAQCVAAASQKLLNSSTFEPNYEYHVLAVFSARLPIELGLGIAATRLALNATCHHLRVLTGVLPHGIVSTCAPSEPILAVAATHIITRNGLAGGLNMYKTALSTLVKKLILQGCLAEHGARGELLAHLILVVTRDCALPRDAAGVPVVYRHGTVAAAGPVVETINLGKFLTALLGNTLEKASIRDGGYSGSASAEALKRWARQYVLNFTHFTQVSASTAVLSSEFLLECWRGGVGIACAYTYRQSAFDMFLVGYRGRLDETFNPYDIGLVLVQVKVHAGAALPTSAITCPDVLYKGERWKPPHLAILMDLGTTSKFEGTQDSRCEIGRDSVKQPVPEAGAGWNQVALPNITEPSRFVINIRGHEPYTVMRPGNVAEDLVTVLHRLSIPPVLEGLEAAKDSMMAGLDPYSRHLPM